MRNATKTVGVLFLAASSVYAAQASEPKNAEPNTPVEVVRPDGSPTGTPTTQATTLPDASEPIQVDPGAAAVQRIMTA